MTATTSPASLPPRPRSEGESSSWNLGPQPQGPGLCLAHSRCSVNVTGGHRPQGTRGRLSPPLSWRPPAPSQQLCRRPAAGRMSPWEEPRELALNLAVPFRTDGTTGPTTPEDCSEWPHDNKPVPQRSAPCPVSPSLPQACLPQERGPFPALGVLPPSEARLRSPAPGATALREEGPALWLGTVRRGQAYTRSRLRHRLTTHTGGALGKAWDLAEAGFLEKSPGAAAASKGVSVRTGQALDQWGGYFLLFLG